MIDIKKIQFIDDDHKRNFYYLANFKFEEALEDGEFASTVYILAIPMLFGKFDRKKLIDSFETPVDWIWRYLAKYKREGREEFDHINPDDVEADYDLTNSMVGMGKLALNLWNKRFDFFNLASTLDRLDDDNSMAMVQAIKIRGGMF